MLNKLKSFILGDSPKTSIGGLVGGTAVYVGMALAAGTPFTWGLLMGALVITAGRMMNDPQKKQ